MVTDLRNAVILDAVRTPAGKGKPGGALSGVHPMDLLAGTLEALPERTGLDPALVEDVIAGCVQQVGEQSGNIARHATLAAGLPETVPATRKVLARAGLSLDDIDAYKVNEAFAPVPLAWAAYRLNRIRIKLCLPAARAGAERTHRSVRRRVNADVPHIERGSQREWFHPRATGGVARPLRGLGAGHPE